MSFCSFLAQIRVLSEERITLLPPSNALLLQESGPGAWLEGVGVKRHRRFTDLRLPCW